MKYPITFRKVYNLTAYAYRNNNNRNGRCFFTTCVQVTTTQTNLGWFRGDGGAQYINYLVIGY